MSAKEKTAKELTGHEAFRDLKEAYPEAKQVNAELWELLIAAMGSDHADMWDKKERTNKMFVVELLGALMDTIYK
ncbi:hypothetical protein [Chitinophaga sp. 22620]|uniref:hypothetical protein n=1 Tax=Chitinophaga sp. 22620 TaxID=3453952 RepID=UPI003F85B598